MTRAYSLAFKQKMIDRLTGKPGPKGPTPELITAIVEAYSNYRSLPK